MKIRQATFKNLIVVFALLTMLFGEQIGFAQTRDQKLTEADEAFDAAKIVFEQNTAESFRAARQSFLKIAAQYAALGEKHSQGVTLVYAGVSADNLSEKQAALESYNQALPLLRAAKDISLIATVLNNIGAVYYSLSDRATALKFYKEALPQLRAAADKDGEAATLTNIGLIHAETGEHKLALEIYAAALKLSRETENAVRETTVLNNLGLLSADTGDTVQALKSYREALALARKTGDQNAVATTLSNIGAVNDLTGDRRQALQNYLDALPLFRAVGNKFGEATTLNNIGGLYDALNNKEQAVKYYDEALNLRRAIGDKRGEAGTLTNIGKVFNELGEAAAAAKVYDVALALFRAVGDQRGEAVTLNNIGKIYSELNKNQNALKIFQKVLPLARAVGDKNLEAKTLSNMGAAYDALDDKTQALAFFQKSLSLARAIGDKSQQAVALGWLSYHWDAAKNPRLAVFYGKQAVNLFQEMRSNIQNFDQDSQKSYLDIIAFRYKHVAEILIAEGRIAEAEQVLQMLKETEFFDFVRRDSNANPNTKSALTPAEREAFANYEKFANEITRTGEAFGKLETIKNELPLGESLTAAQQTEYDKLKKQLDDATTVFTKFLDELKIKFGANDKRVATIESDTQGILKRLNQPRTAVISTIIGEDKLNLIVTTADAQRAHAVEITAAELNKLAAEFRVALKNPNVDPRPLGKKLYDKLFPAGLQKDLDGINADTIVWSLDGILRYIPISALSPDGKTYLVEKYTNAVLTLASRDKIGAPPVDRAKWLVLGVGVSKAATVKNADGSQESFSALAAVPQELCSVVADPKKKILCGDKVGVIAGLNLIDEEFTAASLQNNLGKTAIVHISSHFALQPGNETDSYLLLGGGAERRFSLDNIRKTNLNNVELLTLSACNTAMTGGTNQNGVEVEGFGALAQNKGAKTVLATLWAVADESTKDVMTEFYAELKNNRETGKAAALRRAQLALLKGAYPSAADAAKTRGSLTLNQSGTTALPFKRDDKAPFAHPYFWSPFVLFGNWQ